MPHRDLATSHASMPARWTDSDPFMSLHRQIDRVFDSFFDRGRGGLEPMTGTAWPSIDMEETATDYQVTADLPGLDKSDIAVTVEGDALRISGEKRAASEDRDRRMSERFYGRFERYVGFDKDIDAAKASARFENGVLTVTVPKNPAAADRTRRIEIKG